MTLSFRKSLLTAAALAGIFCIGAPVQAVRAEAEAEVVSATNPTVLRRLTQLQYKNIIADIFGADIKIGGRFEPDMRENGLLELGAGRASIPAAGLAQYANMARSVSAQVLDEKHRASFVACTPANVKASDDACARQFLADAGQLLYRRPLQDGELGDLVAGAKLSADTLKDFYAGLEVPLATMLQSPEFLFRWEVRAPNGGNKDAWQIDAYSKASRLSFFLWNSAPDTKLLTAAKNGDLDTPKGVAREVERMLGSPRLEAGVRAFFYDMFGLDSLTSLTKDTTLYPKYSFKIAADAEEQTLRTIVDVVLTQNGDYRDIFTTRKTFLTRQLGTVYGVPIVGAAAGGTPDGWQPYEFPEGDSRAGILIQPGFLALHSHPGRTSPTLRGKALRESVLCQRVPDPPGNVNFNVVQDTTDPNYKTVRQRLQAHATEAMCTGCHKITDPIGLAMENYDTIGSYRAKENGAPIDTSGTIDGVAFSDAAGLAKAIHDHPATASCLVNRVYSYAVGRTPTAGERDWLKQEAGKAFAASGYKIVPLLRKITLHEAFFRVAPPEGVPTKAAALSPEAGR
ncbi:MAG: DUF1592 domain-containing protein [Rhodospirillaceae bacterium]|nr:DUF1592 domain-containing protein [Rhodospirillaceae bacterium]